ncbi:MAG: two-component system response regulator [Anaerolineaceae bacterium 4572_78]|nr:MAG: two-component system response regulator [Anaerolineaceae bacterium 4572_78]
MSKVMIVDDAQFMRVRLSKLLTRNGYEVVEAENGEQAVKVFKSASPDVVLMDITMPHKDGLEALSEIREFDSKAKVIMLTALGQESMIVQAVQAGAKDYVVKPFNPKRVMSALEKVLG